MSDVLEPPERVPEKYYISEKALRGLILHKERHKAKGHGFGFTKTGLYQVGHVGKNRMGERVYDPKGKSQTLTAFGGGLGAKTGLYTVPVSVKLQNSNMRGRRIKGPGDPSFTITAGPDTGVFNGQRIRKLMPVECERLQGLPDGWTAKGESVPISDNQRWKQIGNAVTVPVGEHVGEAAPMRPLRIDGKPDEERLNVAVKILLDMKILPYQIRRDHFLLIHRTTYQATVSEFLSGNPANLKRYIIHRPDIIVYGRDNTTLGCIIEIDGSAHDTNRGKRKTEKRNSDYWSANIPYVVLNEADLKYLGMSWRDFLWESLLKMGLI